MQFRECGRDWATHSTAPPFTSNVLGMTAVPAQTPITIIKYTYPEVGQLPCDIVAEKYDYRGEWVTYITTTTDSIPSSTMTTHAFINTQGYYYTPDELAELNRRLADITRGLNRPKPFGKVKSWQDDSHFWADIFLCNIRKTHNFVSATLKDENK